jgi:integrase/recombinase XerD
MVATTVTQDSIEEFRTWLSRRGCSRNTLRAYVADVRSFYLDNRLAELDPTELADLTADWINSRREKIWEAKTTQRKLTSLRAYALYLGIDPFMQNYILPKASAVRATRALDGGIEAVQRMLDVCKDETERALIGMLGLCGMRISEALARTHAEFDLTNRLIKIRLGKGMKDRVIPLSDMAYEAVASAVQEAWLEGRETIIEFTDRTARKRITAIGKLAGLEHVASHMLRATFATAAYANSGHDIRAVQELLGHSNVTTTQGYVTVSMDNMRTAADFDGSRTANLNLPPHLRRNP